LVKIGGVMGSCTFFGHKDCLHTVEDALISTLTGLIESGQVNKFYIGNNGGYDAAVAKILMKLKKNYPQIQCTLVLAYLPKNEDTGSFYFEMDSVYPEECGTAPRKFAIDRRNHWMLKKCDYVVTYVERCGGAAKFKNIAQKMGKRVIELAQNEEKKEGPV